MKEFEGIISSFPFFLFEILINYVNLVIFPILLASEDRIFERNFPRFISSNFLDAI